MHGLTFLLGAVVGATVVYPIAGWCASNKARELEGALWDLVRAVESERLAGSYVEVPDTPVCKALAWARKVLEL